MCGTASTQKCGLQNCQVLVFGGVYAPKRSAHKRRFTRLYDFVGCTKRYLSKRLSTGRFEFHIKSGGTERCDQTDHEGNKSQCEAYEVDFVVLRDSQEI